MATFTPNYNLEKPTGAEKYYISKFNANSDKIDTALKTQADAISANLTQEEEDISDLRDELQEYADNKVSAHNLSQEAHPFIQNAIDDALSEAKDYTDAKPNANEVVNAHNISDSAHQDIRDAISGIGSTAQTMIDNSIALHNIDTTAHQDIRTDAENYTDNAIEEHDEDPNAHGGKQVVYTRLTANGNDYISSMSYLDIQTAFSDGQNVSALLNNGGEMPIEVTIDSITAKRIVVDGNNLTLETYTMDSTTNLFTKSTTDYRLSQAAATVGTAVVGEAVVGGEESGADWNAQDGEAGYIANKPFGEIDNGETVIWEGNSTVDSGSIYYPLTPTESLLQEGITYTATIGNDSVEFTVPIADDVISKSETFAVIQSVSTHGGYGIEISLNTNVYTGDTVHLKITSGGATIKKIDPKYIENSFAIVVDTLEMIVKTSADDIRNAVANKMPIYVLDIYDYRSVKNYFVNSNGDISIFFDNADNNSFEIACEDNEVTIEPQITYKEFYTVQSSGGKLRFPLYMNDLYWIYNTTSIMYNDDLYTVASKTDDAYDVYIYRNEKYGDKVDDVLPLTVNELKVTVKNYDGNLVDTDYTIEYTSTIHGIQTVPIVIFMTYDGSSVIGTSTITNGTLDSVPTAPERTGGTGYTYVHVGWGTEAKTTNIVSLENITDGMTVYAVYEKQMAGDTINDSWSTIAASTKDGTYKTKYSVGDLKTVDLGTQGLHQMQLVAFDADDKADGSGKAPMTWVMKDLLPTAHRMNPSKVDGQEGTGSLGGYDKTEMKSYLTETILPLFPADIRNNIVPVTKYQKAYDASGTAFQESTTETLWIPGHKEILNSTSYDTDGTAYSDVFKDATSRIKKRNGSAEYWWLRSANITSSGFWYVGGSGSGGSGNANGSRGVCPGFCM